ncbi:MAG TPA: hypothetical protein VGN42_26190 [Pirellulales bacterium]|jgi:hypothetical protein|nr:hypothetical protein [Pirellulales bacterium]
MSAAPGFVKRFRSQLTRPLRAPLKALLRWLIRQLSTRFAHDIAPLDELAKQVAALSARQDGQEGFHWDHAALAKRLATLEDHLEQLLQQQPRGPDEDAVVDESSVPRPVIRFKPGGDLGTMAPLAHERQYHWDRSA